MGREIPRVQILRNARVWTGDAATPTADAIGIVGESIAAVGDEPSVRAAVGKADEELDLHGRLVLPGFIDNHVHFYTGAETLAGFDLRGASGPEDFAARIREAAAKARPGEWVTSGRWDNSNWPGGVWPERKWIDSFSADVPVFVRRVDGHAALANARALTVAGITKNTPSPTGGAIGRDDRGELTGVLRDAAMVLVEPHVPRTTEEQGEEMLLAALRHAASLGVVSVNDMSLRAMPIYQRLLDRGELTCRMRCFAGIEQWRDLAALGIRSGAAAHQSLKDSAAILGFGNDFLRIGALKAFADGSLGSHTALMFEPYTDDPSDRGLAMEPLTSGALEKELLDADRAGLQLAVHAIGDRANAIVLDIAERLIRKNGSRDRRMRIEHAQHLSPRDIPRFARLGVVASVQPPHILMDSAAADRALGPERAGRTYAFRSLLDAGARVTFGTDWPVAPLNPLEGIHAAVTRITPDAVYPAGWHPEQRVSVAEAVRCYTIENAWAQFEEQRRGSITPGKLADLVVLSDDILDMEPRKIKDARVEMTFVGGRLVFS